MTDFILLWLRENALVTAAIACVVTLICRVARPRPAVEHALWMLVLVKLLVPPVVSWPEEWREALSDVVAFVPAPREAPREGFEDGPEETFGDGGAARHAVDDTVSWEADDVALASHDLEPDGGPGEAGAVEEWPNVEIAVVPGGEDAKLVTPSPASTDLTTAVSVSGAESRSVSGAARRPRADEASSPTAGPFDAEGLARVWLGRVWLGGASLFLLLHTLWTLRFSRTLGSARPAPPELQGEVESLASRLGMRAPRTRLIPGVGSPLAWGLGRPALLLPAGLVERFRHEAWRGIFLHELAHLRRRDHYVGCLLVAAQCIWWWNPVFWYVRRRLGESAELACDAWVVWAAPDERRVYAESLLDVARIISRSSGRSSPLPLTTFFKSRTGRAARREFERRLTMILTGSHRRTVSGLGMLTLVLFALLTVPAWSAGQEPAPTSDGSPETTQEATTDDVPVEVEVDADAAVVFDSEDAIAPPTAVVEVEVDADAPAVDSEDAIAPPTAVIEGAVEVPVLRIDDGGAEKPVVVRRRARFDNRGRAVIVSGDRVDDASGPIGTPRSTGDDLDGADRAGLAIAGDVDSYRGGSDRRIQRIERNIEKLERSIEAVLAELQSLKRERRSSGDAFDPFGRGFRDSGLDTASESTARRRSRTPRRFVEPMTVEPVAPNAPRPNRTSPRPPSPVPPPGVQPSLPGVSSDESTFEGNSSGYRGSARANVPEASSSSPARAPRAARSSRNSAAESRPVPGAAAIAPADASEIRQVHVYEVPDGKARVLAKFLRENVAAPMSIRVKGENTIWIGATDDTLKTIGKLIELLTPPDARRPPARGTSQSVLR